MSIWQAPPSEDASESASTEPRSATSRQVHEYMQRPVDKGLLTSSGSSGPPARRNNPTKVDTHKIPKKVHILCFVPMCVNGTRISTGSRRQSLRRRSHLPCRSRLSVMAPYVLDAPAHRTRARPSRRSEKRSAPHILILKFWEFGNSEILGNFGNFWEFILYSEILGIPKLTLSRKTQEFRGHVTLERTLTRLILFCPMLGW